MTRMLSTTTFLLVSLCGVVVLEAVTLFPHGSAISVQVIDDYLEQVVLTPPVYFHGSPRAEIFISENGMVTFEDNGFYGGIDHPLTETWIAPFGADMIGNVGELRYQIFNTAGSPELIKASALVNEVYAADNFQATQVLVVTWYNVKIDNTNRVNTFQLALSSDSATQRTYAIFLYEHDIQLNPTEIGASAGDGTSFFRVCHVDKYEITFLPIESNSQCATAGVIVFRLDQSTWNEAGYTCTPVYPSITCRIKPGTPEVNRDRRCGAGSNVLKK